jgi:hypothetical protein
MSYLINYEALKFKYNLKYTVKVFQAKLYYTNKWVTEVNEL